MKKNVRIERGTRLILNDAASGIEDATHKVDGGKLNRGSALRRSYSAMEVLEFVDIVDQTIDEGIINNVQEFWKK